MKNSRKRSRKESSIPPLPKTSTTQPEKVSSCSHTISLHPEILESRILDIQNGWNCTECTLNNITNNIMTTDLWLCGSCGFVGCGRYSYKHSYKHYLEFSLKDSISEDITDSHLTANFTSSSTTTTNSSLSISSSLSSSSNTLPSASTEHVIVISLTNGAMWCHLCNDWVINDEKQQYKKEIQWIQQTLEQLRSNIPTANNTLSSSLFMHTPGASQPSTTTVPMFTNIVRTTTTSTPSLTPRTTRRSISSTLPVYTPYAKAKMISHDKLDTANMIYKMKLLKRIFHHWKNSISTDSGPVSTSTTTSVSTKKTNRKSKARLPAEKKNLSVSTTESQTTKPINETLPNRNLSTSSVTSTNALSKTLILPGRTGMRNLGNTCYVNAVIQALGHIESFRTFFIQVFSTYVYEPSSIYLSLMSTPRRNAYLHTLYQRTLINNNSSITDNNISSNLSLPLSQTSIVSYSPPTNVAMNNIDNASTTKKRKTKSKTVEHTSTDSSTVPEAKRNIIASPSRIVPLFTPLPSLQSDTLHFTSKVAGYAPTNVSSLKPLFSMINNTSLSRHSSIESTNKLTNSSNTSLSSSLPNPTALNSSQSLPSVSDTTTTLPTGTNSIELSSQSLLAGLQVSDAIYEVNNPVAKLVRQSTLTVYDSMEAGANKKGKKNKETKVSKENIPAANALSSSTKTSTMSFPSTSIALETVPSNLADNTNDEWIKSSLATQLSYCIRILWSGQWSVFTPASLIFTIKKLFPQFCSYAQQDAQEFFTTCIDYVHEELLRGGLTSSSNMNNQLSTTSSLNTTITMDSSGENTNPTTILPPRSTILMASQSTELINLIPTLSLDNVSDDTSMTKSKLIYQNPLNDTPPPTPTIVRSTKKTKPTDAVSNTTNIPPGSGVKDTINISPNSLQHILPRFPQSDILGRLFSGSTQSAVTCNTCQNRSIRYAHFNCLSLDIPSILNNQTKESNEASIMLTTPTPTPLSTILPLLKGQMGKLGTATDLYSCLRKYTEIEQLTGNSLYFCDHCKIKTEAIRQVSLHALPTVFVFHINRAIWGGKRREKNHMYVGFPFDISGNDLRTFISSSSSNIEIVHKSVSDNNDKGKGSKGRKSKGIKDTKSTDNITNTTMIIPQMCNFRLVAVVEHVGRGIDTGHYICYARNIPMDKDIWYSYDDANVNIVSAETVAHCQAYLLFYEAVLGE